MARVSKISLIAAVGKNTRAIGRDNRLLWKLPGDLQRFKKLTLGRPIIMGKKTFESIGGKPLPNRTNIVLSFEKEKFTGAITANSIEEAIKIAEASVGNEEIFIIGGGQIYKAFLPLADKLYLTIADDDSLGDTFFPDWSEFKNIVFEEHYPENNPPFSFVELTR